MRALGERGDIVKAINRALAARGQQAQPRSLQPAWRGGRDANRGPPDRQAACTDELGDRIGVVIDGIDGRVHHVALPDASARRAGTASGPSSRSAAPVPSGRPTATTSPRSRGTRSIVPVSIGRCAEGSNVRVPGGDY